MTTISTIEIAILSLVVVVGSLLLLGFIRGARGGRSVDWVGLNGSEELFRLLSEQIEKSYQQLSVGPITE